MRPSFAFLALVLAAGCASAGSSRDALLRIVTDCLDTGAPRYCARCPSPQAGTCDLQYPCTRTTEVWAETKEYVAIEPHVLFRGVEQQVVAVFLRCQPVRCTAPA